MAKDLVFSCLYIHDARDTLQRAKMLLKENFGQPYQITSAFISKLTEGPLATNNSSELSAFAIDLETCVITLKGIGCVNEINTQYVLRQIINRLPVPIQHKWRAVADNIMHEAKKNISIEDIVYFVRKQVRELSNPVFGISVKKKVNNQKLFFASAVKPNTDSTKSCLMCLAPHYLNHCKRFRNLSYQDRYKFVIQKKLCFACLQPGHRADRCSRTDCCRKENCNKKHRTLLHPPLPPPTFDKNPASSESAECVFVGFSENKTNDVMLPIVPVKVRASSGGNFVKTYALLDPGSTTTFCSIDLLNELNVTGRYVQLTTTTISNRNVATNAQLIQNLEVCDFNENEHVVLSQCFSLKSLPISKNEIPTKLDASNWDYLNYISMPKLNANVGLLIGCNYPQVLQPLEVIPSQNGGPYALKTLLGWSVIGLRFLKRPNEKNCVFFVKTKFSAVCDMCMDVCSLETTEVSIENKRFLVEVNDSIKLKENNHYEISLPLKFSNLKPPSNREFAYQRLMSLKRKFLKKPSFYNDYVQL